MRRIATYVVAAITVMLPGTPLLAKAPFYFHKPNVDHVTFVTDFSECNELAGGVRAPHYSTYSSNMYAMAASSFFAGFFGSREKRSMTDNVLRTCMADKGYRRVEASSDLMKDLNGMEEKERVDRLFVLAASSQPIGKMLPK